MENILNQKATNSNSNFMDHLYCHPNEITKQYVHTTTTTNENNNNKSNSKAAIAINTDSSSEEGMLQEEVNSLKSMLLFHFDLIQTQAEQLQAKEIELKAQRAECEKLRVRNTQLTGQVADIQQQLEEQMKRNVVIKRTSLPPPPLAKIQCLNENVNNNKGLLLTTISTTTITTASTTTTTTTSCTTATSIPTIANTTLADKTRMPKLAAVSVNIKKLVNNEVNNKNTITTTAVKNMPTIIKLTPPPLLVTEDKSQTINAKLKEKKSTTTTTDNIVNNNSNNNKSLSLIKTTEEEREKSVKNKEYSNETEECAVEEKNNSLIKLNEIKEEININDVKRSSSTLSIKTNTLSSETTNCLSSIRSSTSCSSPASSTTLQGKTKRRRVWQVPELATDDSDNSFDSMLDMETRSAGADDTGSGSGSNSSVDCCEREDCSGCSESGSSLTTATANSEQTLKEPQYLYYSVNSPYLSRPWQEEELDGELEDDIAEALKAAEPKLEIPKWTEHDIVPLYNIEGTEDLNDELFAKRHAKLELDEKRRKKWDVQQIREQRRLEKLRKRHCKDELNQGPVIQSFFPLNEDLERICFVETLPVQAFGEPIPMLPHNGEGFLLPWLLKTDGRPLPPPKKATEFYRFGLKKMTRKEEKLWEEYLDEVEDASQDIENKEEKTDIKLESKAEKETEVVEKPDVNAGEVKEEEEEGGVEVTNSICDNKNPTEKGNLRIADCCYAAPTVMLARDCRPCASRTQQRRRLRYSTYIYLTKRRRQLSLSVKTTTIANNINNSNNLTSTTTSTLASGTKTTSTTTTTSIISISTPTTTTTTSSTTKTNCKNIIKKNSSPSINNKLSTTTTTTTTSSRNITNNRKSKEQQQEKIPSTTTTTASLNKDNKKNNTYNNSTTIITNNNNLDKTKENTTTTTTTTNTATTTLKSSGGVATILNEKSDKTTELTEGTTKILNNSIKSKLRNLRSSSSPCSYISSSNSNSSTILDNTTSTSTATTPTSLSNMTTATTTLVTTTKTK